MNITMVHNGQVLPVEPYQRGRYDTNQSLPLVCGHRHVNGDTIYLHQPSGLAWCQRCTNPATAS